MKTVPMTHPSEAETYTGLFSSAIARFQVAAAIGGSAVWNAEGSRAIAELLLTTAEKFDRHIADLKASPSGCEQKDDTKNIPFT